MPKDRIFNEIGERLIDNHESYVKIYTRGKDCVRLARKISSDFIKKYKEQKDFEIKEDLYDLRGKIACRILIKRLYYKNQ